MKANGTQPVDIPVDYLCGHRGQPPVAGRPVHIVAALHTQCTPVSTGSALVAHGCRPLVHRSRLLYYDYDPYGNHP